jgi:hypothetical protein
MGNKNIRQIIESEESKFDNAWEHAIFHLDIGAGVLFEEFEGRDHKKLYTKLLKVISKIKSEYEGYCDSKSIITQDKYLDLKYLFVNDPNAMKFPFPLRVISHKIDTGLVVVVKINNIAPYLLQKLPWLNDI